MYASKTPCFRSKPGFRTHRNRGSWNSVNYIQRNTDALRALYLCTSEDKYGAKAVSKRTVFIYSANTGTIPWLTSRMHTHTKTTFWTEHWFYTCIHRAAGTWTPVGRWLNRAPRVESEKPLNYVRENGPKRVVYFTSCGHYVYVFAVLENMFSISQLCWVHLRYVLVVLNVNIMSKYQHKFNLENIYPLYYGPFSQLDWCELRRLSCWSSTHTDFGRYFACNAIQSAWFLFQKPNRMLCIQRSHISWNGRERIHELCVKTMYYKYVDLCSV